MMMPSIFKDSIFDDFMDGFAFPAIRRPEPHKPVQNFMRTDVKELDKGYQLSIDIPGYAKDDVKLSLKDGYMTVSAETSRSEDEKDENGKYIRRERYTGRMQRSFYVGENVTETDIKAKFENGILNIEVPKIEKRADESRYIAIEG